MIEVRLESNGNGGLIATDRSRTLPIGNQMEFTLPDGSVLSCVTVGPGSTCSACPLSMLGCPISRSSGIIICPGGGYIIKSSDVMEEL